MGSRRSLSWNSALRDLKADRAVRPDVREERLKPALDGKPLSAWRGVSGRRYVSKVLPLRDPAVPGYGAAVFLAVGRDDAGVASIVSVACDIGRESFEDWRGEVETAGATEMHVHALAETAEERSRIAYDVWGEGTP